MSGIVLEINPFKGYDQETGETTYHSASEFAGGFTSAAEGSLIRFLRIEDDNGNDITPETLRFQWQTLGAGLYGENRDEYNFPLFGRGGQDISLSAGGYTSGKITITSVNNGNALPPEINITDSSESANSFGITYSKSTDPENFGGGGISGLHTTQYRLLANGETIATSTSGNITTESSPFITTYTAEVEYMDAQGYVRTITSDEAITLGLISEDPAMEFSSFHDVHLLPLNQYSWPGFDFISQDRDLSDGNNGLSLYTGDEEILISGNRYSLSENNDPGSIYLFSDPEFLSQSTWIDLDGNVTREDGSSPLNGEQGNQRGDDLISNFDRVDYNGEFSLWDPYRQGYSFALLSDEQGQYVLIQDRNLDDGDDGTDTLRNINQLNFQFGENVALSPLNSWGDPNHNYLFSNPEFLSQSTWIDLDGNVTREDGSSPLNGEQGNQRGDDLISNFDRVDYNGEFSLWDPYRQGYSFALLSDEQGQYVLIQDRNLDDGDDGTDTLRNINQLNFQFGENVALSPLNSWGDPNHNYLFSNPEFLSQSTWIDLDGNVTREDGSSPLNGEQGNQRGDDLISNFDRVDYNGEFSLWDPYRQGYSFALLSDEQGQYVLIQDRNLDDGDDGTDTLRNINQLNFQFGENVALSPLNSWGDPNHNYLFSNPEFLSQSTWIDLDGNVTREDGSSPLNGEQGNQRGDDLISNFDRVDYNGEFSLWDPYRQGYSFALLSDEQGQYVLIQDRNLDDGDDGTDTLRNINQLNFQFGENVALSPLNSWGDPNHNYLFSNPEFLSQSTWIDLDGNVTREDGSSPLNGEQGNQRGDDLISNFDRVDYNGEFSLWDPYRQGYSFALLSDEQGQYVLIQDRNLDDGDDGTDTLRNINQLNFQFGENVALSPLNSWGDPNHNYLFSNPEFLSQSTWIDLDGNVTREDGSSPLNGEQGNQRGDDLISNFDRVDYNGEFSLWDPYRQGYSFALLSDEQGQYVLIQDRNLDDGDDGTDTLRNINQLNFQFGENVALSPLNSWGDPNHNYLFSNPEFLSQSTWIDLDGNVTREDGSSPLNGEQGNQRGDDLISNFDRVDYNGEFSLWDPYRQGYSFALLSDEQGQYVLIQDRNLDDGDDGTDTLRNINQLNFQFGENVALSPLNSWGDPNHNYLFSNPEFLSQSTWIDLDGNVTREDGSSPLNGEQGNQRGDDLISNFDRVDYNGEFSLWDPYRQGYSFALLSDEQGQYVLIQDRNLDDGDDGTDTLRNINQLNFQFGENVALSPLNSWGDPNHNYLFSNPEFLSQSTWIDLDGNVTREDGSSPLNGEQGNQRGDDLISNFDRVDYNGEFSLWDPYRQGYSFALLSDEQGQYVLIQDRNLDDGDDGTDTLRNINQLNFQFGENVALSPLNSWGDPNHNYLFSNPEFLSQSTWIDLDGNVTREDGSSPLNGEQGNQRGDDLISNFDRIYYSDSEPWHSSVSDLAIARLRDEQGEYFIVQDRLAGPDNQGTDTLRRVNTLDIHGFEWDLTGSGEGNYYFSEQNYNDRDIWIDLDGNVTREDGSSPLNGEQGNQHGDDLIIGFDRVSYSDRSDSDPYGSLSNLAIARLRDEQGDYFIVQDRSGNSDNQGTDTLRRVDTLEIDSYYDGFKEWDLTGSGNGDYYFAEQNYNHKDIWIDLDGQISYLDYNGDLITPQAGEQGNQSGDDLIIGFEELKLDGVMSDYRITKARDLDGYFYQVTNENSHYGTDTLRNVDSIKFDDSVYLFNENIDPGDRALRLQALLTSESLIVPQVAVLGDSVDHDSSYSLLITGESLRDGYSIESADITLHFDPLLFGEIKASDVRIGGELPIANAVDIDNETGTVRLAAASLSALGAGESISSETVIASISLDFDETALATIEKNSDGSLVTNPLSFSLSANADETVFTKDFVDAKDLLNREIVTLNDLGGYMAVDSEDVTLYEAKINFEQQGDGLVLGTQRVIGSDATFTNLIRSGDTLTTSVDWLNVGNIQANNLSYSEVYNQNATLASADFSQTSVASGSFIDGVFVKDARESTTLTTAIKVTGEAGNVLDLSDGIVSIQADGSETFTNQGQGSSNLITFQGDLNYDGRVSMKDLAYLNAGAARQQLVESTDENGNTVQVASEASYARDVDADFSGKIDLADLSVLDADWGKTLHTGDEQFQGSADLSWSELDSQGSSSTWDNDSFKDQNAIEAESDYVGSLEAPGTSGVTGSDGNQDGSNSLDGEFFQNDAEM